ncbi:MAG TPA: hypothetical protein VHY33_03295 [Thermoanaerobaculia bacterium]|jgi:uncharacterized membrane protein YccC|nr:hypothetical protein [Thermoanaerobaculia bacterium]
MTILRRIGAVIAGMIVAFAVVAFMLPQPIWFSVASIVIYIGATWVGARAGTPVRLSYA